MLSRPRDIRTVCQRTQRHKEKKETKKKKSHNLLFKLHRSHIECLVCTLNLPIKTQRADFYILTHTHTITTHMHAVVERIECLGSLPSVFIINAIADRHLPLYLLQQKCDLSSAKHYYLHTFSTGVRYSATPNAVPFTELKTLCIAQAFSDGRFISFDPLSARYQYVNSILKLSCSPWPY